MPARFRLPAWFLPLAVLFLAAFVRFHRLDAQSLWNDEGNSLRLAQRSIGSLIDNAGRDIHPPGYYLVLKGWIGLVGESEFGLRALSAFEGVLMVAAAMALGRALFSRTVGILAGLLVALSSFAVYYSQETRMYAQLGLLSTVSIWLLVMWLRHISLPAAKWEIPTLAGMVGLALCNTAGLYTQYSYPFTLLVQGLWFGAWFLWQRNNPIARRALIGYIGLNGLTLVLFLPWLPTAWHQVTTWPRTGIPLALGDQLRTVLTWIVYGSTAGRITWTAFVWPGLLILAAIGPDHRKQTLPFVWRITLPFAWAGMVIGALLVSGAYREANLKFLLPAQVAVALLIGRGAEALWAIKKVGPPLAVGCLALLTAGQIRALNALYTDPAYARDDYRAIAARLAADSRPGDAIILDAPNQAEVFTYYYRGPAPIYGLPRGLGGDDDQTRAEVQDVIAHHSRIFVLFWGEAERDPHRVVQATLDADAFPVSSTWIGHIRLAQYAVLGEPPGTPQVITDARFGDHIALASYALNTANIRPGDVIGVTLFWQTDVPLAARYKVTVQLLAPDGSLASQHDCEPGNNLAPTTTWIPGESIIDPHGLVIPIDAPPGQYTLIVGLYDLNPPYPRLPVAANGMSTGDRFLLALLCVK